MLTLSITINYDGYVNSLSTRGFNLVLLVCNTMINEDIISMPSTKLNPGVDKVLT